MITVRVMAALDSQPQTPVLVDADKNVDYGSVIKVMAVLKNAGITKLGFMTRPEEQ